MLSLDREELEGPVKRVSSLALFYVSTIVDSGDAGDHNSL
jgi:hypothetical protein